MLVRQQRMVCFDDGDDRFQMRAAGVAFRDGHVLVHRATREDFWTLPGGRVEQGETSAQTLGREMVEELGQAVEIGRLLFICESMFGLAGRRYHEVGFYFEMTVPQAFPFTSDQVCHRVTDGDAQLEFKWVAAEPEVLERHSFQPAALRASITSLPAGVRHFVDSAGDLPVLV